MTLQQLLKRRQYLADLVSQNDAAIARACRAYGDANGYRTVLRPDQVMRYIAAKELGS